MKLIFKQRFFSWFDSYDIYYEDGSVAFRVEGQLSWGHKLHILNAGGAHIATVKEKIFRFLPTFELYEFDRYIGCIKKQFTFFSHNYSIDFKGWQVVGNFLGWDYSIMNAQGMQIAQISKQIFNWTDTYVIDVANPADALHALMFTLAIDAEKCSNNK
ncbi:MAG: LURP-one-related family protein [Clostridia bacterium]|nr:LURP-one-related family protein [Clostridia bacterium]